MALPINPIQPQMQPAPHNSRKGLWVLLLVVVLVVAAAYLLVSRPHGITQTNQETIIPQLSVAEKKAIASQFTTVPTVSAKEKKDISTSFSSSNSAPAPTSEQKRELVSQFVK